MALDGTYGFVYCGIAGLVILAAPGEIATVSSASAGTPDKKAPYDCKAPASPYTDYSCLDAYLGNGFFERLTNYYRLEWGHDRRRRNAMLKKLCPGQSGVAALVILRKSDRNSIGLAKLIKFSRSRRTNVEAAAEHDNCIRMIETV